MDDELNTDPKHLKTQIRQVKEVVSALENAENAGVGMECEELWPLIKMNLDDNEPIYPRLARMIHGYADVEDVRRGLKRLENDLSDLKAAGDGPKSLYQELENDINGQSNDNTTTFEYQSDTDENQTSNELRDKDQLPLNADYET